MSSAIADLVLDANYEGPHATPAEYFAPDVRPVSGGGLPVALMRAGEERGLDLGGLNVAPVVDSGAMKCRVKELAAPEKGGRFYLPDTDEHFLITAAPERLDRARREWTCQGTITKAPD